jgi:hypothetical protein
MISVQTYIEGLEEKEKITAQKEEAKLKRKKDREDKAQSNKKGINITIREQLLIYKRANIKILGILFISSLEACHHVCIQIAKY